MAAKRVDPNEKKTLNLAAAVRRSGAQPQQMPPPNI
jgi:hypothetical protein